MKTIKELSFGCAQEEPMVLDERTSAFIRHVDMFSSITTDSLYILDILQKQFCYVKSDDLFLCGFSVEEALILGYDFYSKIVYPEDLSLWTDMRNAVLRYLKDFEEKRDEIDCFSCTFRLQRTYSFISRPLPQMIYHQMKPVWVDNELRYLICSVGSSTMNESGNLCLHNKDRLTFEEYNFTTKRWKQNEKEVFTERERAILMLARQGKNSVEIASDLCRGQNTIQNQINALFKKLGVHSMQEVIDIVSHYGLLYPQQDMRDTKASDGKKQGLFLDDRLQRIQQYLNQQKSIREIARQEGTSESTIRYWIKKRILRKS